MISKFTALNGVYLQAAFYSVCLFFASLTFSTALAEVSFVAALISWLLWKISTKSLIAHNLFVPGWRYLLIFTAISCLSIVWSEDTAASFRGVFKVLQQVLLFWMVAEVFQDEKLLLKYEKFFAVVIGLMALNAFIQHYLGFDLIRGFKPPDSYAGIRVTGSFKSYGLLAAFIILTLPYLAALMLRFRRRSFVLYVWSIAGVLLLLTTLYWTRSRGAWLGLAAGVACYLISLRRFRILAWFFVSMMLVVVLLPLKVIFHFDVTFSEQSLVERVYLWDRALHVIKAKPLTGTGINTYAGSHAKYDRTDNWRVKGYYAHNGYLQMAAETGIPSLIAFILFLLSLTRESCRREFAESPPGIPVHLGLLTGIISFCVMVFVDTILHNSVSVMAFWFLLGMLTVYLKKTEA